MKKNIIVSVLVLLASFCVIPTLSVEGLDEEDMNIPHFQGFSNEKVIEFQSADGVKFTREIFYLCTIFNEAKYAPDGRMIHGGLQQLKEHVGDRLNLLKDRVERSATDAFIYLFSKMNSEELQVLSRYESLEKAQDIMEILNEGWEVRDAEGTVKFVHEGWLLKGINFDSFRITNPEDEIPEPRVYIETES